LALLVDSLFSNLNKLQQPPYHPKWQELAPLAPVAGWTRFRAAQEWIDRNATAPAASTHATAAPRAPADSPPDDPTLYREFLQWRANHLREQQRADSAIEEPVPIKNHTERAREIAHARHPDRRRRIY
jgi:hypothetical protein